MGQTIADGAQLAADEASIETDDGTYRFRIKRYDSGLGSARGRQRDGDRRRGSRDPGRRNRDQRFLATRPRRRPADLHHLPGRRRPGRPRRAPERLRIAPTDHGTAFRLAEYLVPKGLKIGLVADDSAYGQEGRRRSASPSQNPEAVAISLTVPAGADLALEVLRARRADATAFLVWGQPTTIAGVLAAARTSAGTSRCTHRRRARIRSSVNS